MVLRKRVKKRFVLALPVIMVTSCLIIAPIFALPLWAQNGQQVQDSKQPDRLLFSKAETQKIGRILLLVLILAVLLETGLATLFNWRLFLLYGEGRGLKIPIAVTVAFLFVNQFKIDAIAEILSAFSVDPFEPGLGGRFMTALIVAGGSNAVFSLFERFGLRNPLERRETAQAMRQQSQIKIQVMRNRVSRAQPIKIELDDKIIGVIQANRNNFGGFLGYAIEPGQHSLKLSGLDAQGSPISSDRIITLAPGVTLVESFQL